MKIRKEFIRRENDFNPILVFKNYYMPFRYKAEGKEAIRFKPC